MNVERILAYSKAIYEKVEPKSFNTVFFMHDPNCPCTGGERPLPACTCEPWVELNGITYILSLEEKLEPMPSLGAMGPEQHEFMRNVDAAFRAAMQKYKPEVDAGRMTLDESVERIQRESFEVAIAKVRDPKRRKRMQQSLAAGLNIH